MPRGRSDLAARFWSKVDRTGPGCWPWLAGRHASGYGKFSVPDGGKGKTVRAHRVAFALAVGTPAPDDMDVCHTCDNPTCCRPVHLFLGTDASNAADKVSKHRQARGERIGRGKLSATAVHQIRHEYQRGVRGVSGPALGRRYGVTPRMVRLVARGEAWRVS